MLRVVVQPTAAGVVEAAHGRPAWRPTGPHLDGGVVEMRHSGTFHFMSTRNNAFTNRSQKGSLTVRAKLDWALILGVTGAVLFPLIVALTCTATNRHVTKHPEGALARSAWGRGVTGWNERLDRIGRETGAGEDAPLWIRCLIEHGLSQLCEK